MENLKILDMNLEKDKVEIGLWETKYKDTQGLKDINHFILEDNCYYTLEEIIEINYEQAPIGSDEIKKAKVVKNQNNEIVAFLIYQVYGLQSEVSSLFLQYITINPEYQHKGYGKAILTEFFSNQKKYATIQPDEFFAVIDNENEASKNLFKSFGFSFDNKSKNFLMAKATQHKIQSSLNDELTK